jgi:hypothetical protein
MVIIYKSADVAEWMQCGMRATTVFWAYPAEISGGL